MKLHHLRPAEGSKKERTRVGRGRAGARGKLRLGFEGGQMPLIRRVPKLKGFKNPNRTAYAPVNVELLAKYFDGEVTPEAIVGHGLAHKGAKIKVLARGEIDKALTVKAHAFSKTAREKIEAAGGTIEVLD